MSFERVTPFASVLETTGIRYILLDADAPAAVSLLHQDDRKADAVPRPQRPAAVRDTRPPMQQPGQQQHVPQQPAQKPVQRSESVPPAAPAQTVRRVRRRVPAEAWPANWRELLGNAQRAPICWTYAELGLDLTGHADAQHRDYLKKLLLGMHRKAGTHTFWPCALPEGPDLKLVPNCDIFWSGLQELGVKMLIVMGSAASNAIGLSGREVRPLHTMRANGFFICFAWDFAHIREDTRRLGAISRYLTTTCNQLGI